MEIPMPSSDEFDEWAGQYDEDVKSNSGFPFDGYNEVLDAIVEQSGADAGTSVLDLGVGTGNLALRFLERDCWLWGLDYSEKMLEVARAKLPGATLAQVDITAGEWPLEFRRRFDTIVSGYTFHHFPLKQKVELIERLVATRLFVGGHMVIGDLAFRDADEQAALRQTLGDAWEQEHYWLADETMDAFAAVGFKVRFTKISSCAGVFKII